MKEELKRYFNIEICELEEQKRELNNNYILYYDLLQEIKDRPEEEREKAIEQYNREREEREKKLVSINNKIDLETIEKNILYNNIIYLFYKNYHNKIMEIMGKYENKNIGEKTKEKINNEIKEELKKDGIFSTVYFSFGEYSSDIYKLNFTIYETEKEKYNNYFTYRNEKTGSIIIHNNMLWEKDNYNFITDTKKTSQEILKKCKKNIEKVNLLIEKAKETRKENSDLLNIYKINNYEFIDIKYNQTL